jgi:hypothetical protein
LSFQDLGFSAELAELADLLTSLQPLPVGLTRLPYAPTYGIVNAITFQDLQSLLIAQFLAA